MILGIAFLLNGCEDMLKGRIAVSGLWALMSVACILKTKLDRKASKRISEKFGKLLIGAEAVLFVLVGAEVDIRCVLKAGAAAISSVPLALGLPCGSTVLPAEVLKCLSRCLWAQLV